MELSDQTRNEIIQYIEDNPPTVYWDYRDQLQDGQIEYICEKGREGLDDLYMEIVDNNIDTVYDMEIDLCQDIAQTFDLEDSPEDIRGEFLDFICVDFNVDELIRNTPDITALVVVHSNYDCTTSWQSINETDEYLGSVYQRVKAAVDREDFLNEFTNGYTAELLCFVFKTDIKTFIKLKDSFIESITIPKGTQYGFFGSFNGSGSMFEARTITEITLPKVEPNMSQYDSIQLICDVQQSYSMSSVYGDTAFVDEQEIYTR